MAVYNTSELLTQLQKDVESTILQLQSLKELSSSELLTQPAQDKWSIAQVLEHLNGYNRFYLPVMERAINATQRPATYKFKPGILGDYFAKLMQPEEDGTLKKKMNAPKEYSYTPDLDIAKVLSEFEAGQKRLLLLLKQASSIDIAKAKIPISISRFVKLKLGDGFRFLIAHQIRHFVQIQHVKKHMLAGAA